MKEFTKRYQLWKYADSAYTFEEFDTLEECIKAPKYGDWYITKRVSLTVSDADEQVNITSKAPPIHVAVPEKDIPENEAPDPVLTAYLRGGTGHITPSTSA